MIKFLKDLFANKTISDSTPDKEHILQIASCALFLELANSDDEFTSEEKNKIVELMKSQFNISDSDITNLIKQSEKKIAKSVSIYEFTEIINEQINHNEKYEIVKNLWQLAFIDGRLDKYEDYYIRKISNNLQLSNQDRISAKLEVKEEMKL